MGSDPEKKRVPVALSKRGEDVLRAVHFYRYVTALDIAHLLYSPSSITHVRSLLASLCGGADGSGNAYLYRFALPSVSVGNTEKVYILGRLGREFLESEGEAVNWHYRPEAGRRLSFSQLIHNLTLTRVLIAAKRFGEMDPHFSLAQVRTCYELGAQARATGSDGREKAGEGGVIPDGWLLFERAGGGFPVLLEIDRGTMYRERFKAHVASRIAFVRSGAYQRMLGTEAVVIAYATTGQAGEAHEGRRKALCSWTQEVLREQQRERWADVFRFASVSLAGIYKSGLFEKAVWFKPDSDKPLELFSE